MHYNLVVTVARGRIASSYLLAMTEDGRSAHQTHHFTISPPHLFRQHALYQAQLVGVALPLAVVDAVLVDGVDADFSVGVHDLIVFEHHADVHDAAFGVVEESEVAGLGLGDEVHGAAVVNLLAGIARQLYTHQAVKLLGQARAVEPENAFAAPHVRLFQIHQGRFAQQGGLAGGVGHGGRVGGG